MLIALVLAAFASADLSASGWTHIADTEQASVFMKAAEVKPGEMHKVWTAYELDEPGEREGFSFRSVRSLSEYDCKTHRTRVVAETFHAEEGLSGKEWTMPNFVATDWAEVGDGSIGAMRMEFACPVTS